MPMVDVMAAVVLSLVLRLCWRLRRVLVVDVGAMRQVESQVAIASLQTGKKS